VIKAYLALSQLNFANFTRPLSSLGLGVLVGASPTLPLRKFRSPASNRHRRTSLELQSFRLGLVYRALPLRGEGSVVYKTSIHTTR